MNESMPTREPLALLSGSSIGVFTLQQDISSARSRSPFPAVLTILSEERNETLRQGVREHQLGTDDQDLGRQALKECAHSLCSNHVLNNGHSPDLGVEVGILNTGLHGRVSNASTTGRDNAP
jgi:hypothetical protein